MVEWTSPGRPGALVVAEFAGQFRGRVLPVSEGIAAAWGALAAVARRTGRDLPVVEGLFLATAQVHDLTLVTRNTEDTCGRGVAVVDPWGGGGWGCPR